MKTFWTVLLMVGSWLGARAAVPVVPPPPPATQAEVNAGTATRPYVSPATLAAYGGGPTNGITRAVATNVVNQNNALSATTATTATNLATSLTPNLDAPYQFSSKLLALRTATTSDGIDRDGVYALVYTNNGYMVWRDTTGTNFISRNDPNWLGFGYTSPCWSLGLSNDTGNASILTIDATAAIFGKRIWADTYAVAAPEVVVYDISTSNSVYSFSMPVRWNSGITNLGKEFYVSKTTGYDLNDGLTPVTAFKTLGAAAAVATNSGDGIVIFGGSYDDASWTMPDGTYLFGIGQVILTNRGVALGANCLVQNIRILGSTMSLASTNGNTIVRDCEVYDVNDGFYSGSTLAGEIWFQNSYIHSTFDAVLAVFGVGGSMRFTDCRVEAKRTGAASNRTSCFNVAGAGTITIDGGSCTISNSLSLGIAENNTNAIVVIGTGATTNFRIRFLDAQTNGVGHAHYVANFGSGTVDWSPAP